MIGFNNTFFANIKKKQILFKKHHLFFAYCVIGIAVGGGGVIHLGHLFILNLKKYYETHDY